jgi:hypothetical protein
VGGESLGTALGGALPQDPINTYLTCGRCEGSGTICNQNADCGESGRCNAVEGRDPATCWSNASSTYACPILNVANRASVSRVYQYRSIGNGDRFELSTELEMLGPSEYRPPLITEIRRCRSGVEGLCQTDADCAPLVSGRPGPTIPGSCAPAGGRWVYGDMCRGRAFGSGELCGDGVVNTRTVGGRPAEVCELGQTQLPSVMRAVVKGACVERTAKDLSFLRACAPIISVNGRVDATVYWWNACRCSTKELYNKHHCDAGSFRGGRNPSV